MANMNNHDHDHDNDLNLENTIVLVDEDGTEHEFVVLEYLEIEDQFYAVLLPEDDPEGEAFIFKVEVDESGEEFLMDIEDDEEFERIVAVLESDE